MRTCLLVLLVVSSVSSVALADEPGAVTVLPVTHVIGRRQVPGVVPVLSRSRFRYRAPELERHATDAIVESVTHQPF